METYATQELKGVHGWLAWFVAALCAIGPALIILRLLDRFAQLESQYPAATSLASWHSYKIGSYVLFVVITSFKFAAGYMLTNVFRRVSVRLAIAVLWGSPVAAFIGTQLILSYSFGRLGGMDELATSLFQGFLQAVVWTWYLLVSKRVKNTYS